MTGEWIGSRWSQPTGNPERDRLGRKLLILLARCDASRTPALIRRRAAYANAAEIVRGRLLDMQEVRRAA